MKKHIFEKPFTLSIGPQKCGSNILYNYFKSRKDICLPDTKDLYFFDRHFHRGTDFYKGHFHPTKHHHLIMDISTTTFDAPQAPELIKTMLGTNVKLFCPLRDPVQRAYAAYREYLGYGIVKGSIEEACEQAPQILCASRYTRHLEQWATSFPIKSIHFIPYESLIEQRETTLKPLCHFLDIPFKTTKTSPEPEQEQEQDPCKTNPDIRWLTEQLSEETKFLRLFLK